MTYRKRLTKALLVGAVGLSVGLPAITAPAANAATTWTVDDRVRDNDDVCPAAQFTTISAAVAVAQPGDTIEVCEGTYRETVAIDKPDLTIVGPHRVGLQVKHDAQIISPSGGFVVGPHGDGAHIQGFLIRGAGSDGSNAAAIEATSGASDVYLTSNGLRDNAVGVRVTNADQFSGITIASNDFKQNVGTDVIVPGAAHNLRIQSNRFWNNGGLAIDFRGDSETPSVGLVINSNQVKSERLVEVANTQNAEITGSKKGSNMGSLTGSAITDRGNNTGLYLLPMRVGASNGTAIMLSDDAGVSSVNTYIRGANITAKYGIVITGDNSSLQVVRTQIRASDVGISIDSGRGNQFINNTVTSDDIACQDLTEGVDGESLNFWVNNKALRGSSTPANICPLTVP